MKMPYNTVRIGYYSLYCLTFQILEQDVKLICAQEDHVARTGQPLSQAFLPIKTSDGLVIEIRKWLDRVGHGMPHFTGWNKRKVRHLDRRRYSLPFVAYVSLLS